MPLALPDLLGLFGEESAGRATSATNLGQSVMGNTRVPTVSVSTQQHTHLFFTLDGV